MTPAASNAPLGGAAASPALPEPSGALRVQARRCRWCGEPFVPAKSDQEYCRSAHRQASHALRYKRGAELYEAAIAWRKHRQRGGFTKLARIVDGWLAEDRARTKGDGS